MFGSTSRISKIRREALAASWVTASSHPIEANGQIRRRYRVTNATKAPSDSELSATATTPPNVTPASTICGYASNTVKNAASVTTLASSAVRSVEAPAVKRAPICGRRPKDLITRMPWADSSTMVARSPVRSWARRASRL